MSTNAEEDELVTNLRAIIISSKGGLPLNHVKGDYRETFGTEIPLRKLGYRNLEDFFSKKPKEFKLFDNRVEAVAKATSLHIASLVNEQNDGKKRIRSRLRPNRQRRPVHSGSHSVYKPVVGQNSSSKRPSYEIHPKFQKEVVEKQILSIGKPRDRSERVSDASSTKSSDKEEPVSKFSKRENGTGSRDPLPVIPAGASKHGAVTKTIFNDRYFRPEKNESEDVFEISVSEDVIPFDSFEDSERSFGAQSRLLKRRNEILATLKDGNEKENVFLESPPPSETSSTPFLSPTAPFTDFEENIPTNTRRSAQARIEALKSSAKTENAANGKIESEEKSREWTEKLKDLCKRNGYPEPIFETTHSEPNCFYGKVAIGKKLKLSSYPVDQPDERGAQEIAAKKAYGIISSEIEDGLLDRSEVETALLNRIWQVVGDSYGLWSDKVPGLYLETHGEPIDPNWFSVIQKSAKFELQSVDSKRFIISKKLSLEEEGPAGNLESHKNVISASLTLPASLHWEIYVVNVKNSSQVWCRLIGEDYSDKYDEMMTQLELQPPKRKVITPYTDNVYAINVEGAWNRVKFIEAKENNKGTVFFIDSGEEEEIELGRLLYLEEDFLQLPPQAISLSLHELDCFSDDESVSELVLAKLLAHIYIAEIVSLLDVGKSVASVLLWDTSTDEDINVNSTLLDAVVRQILPPRLETSKQIREVFVTEITDQGDIYIITNKEAIERIDAMISKQTVTGIDRNSACTSLLKNSKDLYLTRCQKTGKYARARAIEKIDDDTAIVLFVDIGTMQKTKIDDLYNISKISTFLAGIPPQALKIRLSNVEVKNGKTVGKLRDVIPRDQVVLVKSAQVKEGIHWVNMFKRTGADNSLISIEGEMTKPSRLQPTETRERKKSETIGLENVLYSNLKPPYIPSVKKFFDVYVTLAASPDLFTVQPLRTQTELVEVMEQLQTLCGQTGGSFLRESDCAVGNLYAVKHPDDSWYRGVLHAVLGSSMFSIYLCDYGDFLVVPLEKLLPLPEKLKDFPYQAIRAKLHGIAPANKDWSAIDCVDFQNLVVDKEFVSTVEEIHRDPKNPNNVTLELTLTDTSGDDDIFIDKLLIQKKCAIDITKQS